METVGRRTLTGIGLTLAVLLTLPLAGCGGGQSTPQADSETPAAGSPAQTGADAEPESNEAEAESIEAAPGEWSTVVTLKSTDPSEVEGLLLSEPFTADGTIRLVLDMPGGASTDGVILAIVDADKTDPLEILGVIADSESATLLAQPEALASKEISGLKGSFRVLNSVPADKPWSVEVQVQG